MKRPPRDPVAILAALLDLPEAPIREALALVRAGGGYERFELRKTGKRGPRIITAPKEPVKGVQRALITLLEPLALSSSVHGFRRGRSIVTGARAHLAARSMISIDLKDFFHSVDRDRVIRTLERSLVPRLVEETHELDRTEAAALVGVIAELVTAPVEGRPAPVLPQGAPTSPHLANLAARPLDVEIRDFLRGMPGQLVYTRYADDLTISAPDEIHRSVLGEVLRLIQRVGFAPNPEKIRLASTIKGSANFTQKLEITGLILDPREGVVRIPRARMERYRAQIHQAALTKEITEDAVREIEGIVSFVHMVYGKLPASLDNAYQRFRASHGRAELKPGKSRRMARRRAAQKELYSS